MESVARTGTAATLEALRLDRFLPKSHEHQREEPPAPWCVREGSVYGGWQTFLESDQESVSTGSVPSLVEGGASESGDGLRNLSMNVMFEVASTRYSRSWFAISTTIGGHGHSKSWAGDQVFGERMPRRLELPFMPSDLAARISRRVRKTARRVGFDHVAFGGHTRRGPLAGSACRRLPVMRRRRRADERDAILWVFRPRRAEIRAQELKNPAPRLGISASQPFRRATQLNSGWRGKEREVDQMSGCFVG